MEWANPVVDLAAASPAYVPLPGGPAAVARANATYAGLLATLPWLVCVGGALGLTVWFVDRRTRTPVAAVAVCSLACAVGAMTAATIVWLTRDGSPITIVPAEMQALRAAAAPRAFTIDLTGRPRFDPVDVRAMPIEVPIRRAGRGGFRAPNRPLASFSQVPAGWYDVFVERHGAAEGWIMAGVTARSMLDRDQVDDGRGAGVMVDLPVDCRRLSIPRRGGGTRSTGRDRAVSAFPSRRSRRHTASPGARSVRRDERVFMNDDSYPEPAGFWVAGGHETSVVIAPDRHGAAMTLWVRNGAAPNVVTLESGSWRDELSLGAGEGRRVDVPLERRQTSARVRIGSAATFRPSEVDPNSRDTRLLGVFVELTVNR